MWRVRYKDGDCATVEANSVTDLLVHCSLQPDAGCEDIGTLHNVLALLSWDESLQYGIYNKFCEKKIKDFKKV